VSYERCIKAQVPDLNDFNGIMLVGEAPGLKEQQSGVPFVGDAGKLLDHLLADAGIERDRCVVTNVFHVRPANNMVGLFFGPKGGEVCLEKYPYLGRFLLADLKPEIERLSTEVKFFFPHLKVIVALGAVALWALTGRNGITANRGTLIHFQLGDNECVLVPTFHPSFLLRSNNPAMNTLVVHDLTVACNIAGKEQG
jgi:uracil-DNA glycosylase